MTNTLILQLLHGRDTADEEMNGWGFNGPAIPVECCGFTYDTLWFVPVGGDRTDLPKAGDLIRWDGKLYGDFQIFSAD